MGNGFGSDAVASLLPPGCGCARDRLARALQGHGSAFQQCHSLDVFTFVNMCLLSIISTCMSTRLSGFSVAPSLDVGIRPTVVGDRVANSSGGGINIRYDFQFWGQGLGRGLLPGSARNRVCRGGCSQFLTSILHPLRHSNRTYTEGHKDTCPQGQRKAPKVRQTTRGRSLSTKRPTR